MLLFYGCVKVEKKSTYSQILNKHSSRGEREYCKFVLGSFDYLGFELRLGLQLTLTLKERY